MNKQFVEEVKIFKKKAYLSRINNIAMLLYRSLIESETMSLFVKDKKRKEIENEFLRLWWDTLRL